jgi:hypothetical protein
MSASLDSVQPHPVARARRRQKPVVGRAPVPPRAASR